ncbi:MAG: HDOD domain-containing protein [Gammaproteobacteria bacterium]|nr:HDOD domain-containing protein [Gammaproteobacteria bacterium]
MLYQLPDKLLNKLSPINQLSSSGREKLGEKSHITQVKPGQMLSSENLNQWYIYLVKGRIQLKADGTPSTVIDVGSKNIFEPLFNNAQAHVRALAQEPCHILRFEKQLFNTLLEKERQSGTEVVEISVNEAQGELFKQVFQAYHAGNLDLPTMPDVAMKIAKTADDPDAGIEEIVKIVQLEATVAGSLIQAANSPLYRGTKQIDSIKNAIVRLGLKTTRSLATSIALRETFQVKSTQIKQAIHGLWEHTVNISALSYAIARRVDGFDPEYALMAGLLHDIGAIPILKYLEQNSTSSTPDELKDSISKLRAMVGVLVINYWGLDSELITVVEEAEDWHRDNKPEPDYCDIVIMAHLCDAMHHKGSEEFPKPSEVPAFHKLGLVSQDEEEKLQIFSEAEEEISGIRNLLNG